MNERYIVELTEEERVHLGALVAGGSRLVRDVKRAQVLLAADAGASDEDIARSVQVGTPAVYRTKRRFVVEGLEAAIPRPATPGLRTKAHRMTRRAERRGQAGAADQRGFAGRLR